MKLSAILAPMIAAGVSGDVIMATVVAFEAQAEGGREKARARWHKWKDSKRLQTFANDSRARDLEIKQTNKEGRKEDAAPAAKRGSRIPADFQPDIAAAIAEGVSRSQAELQARSFVDYWTAKPGAAACKLDWPATWRVWFRRNTTKATSPPPRQANGVVAAAQRIMGESTNGSESIFGNHCDVELVPAKPVHEPGRAVEDLRGGVGRRYGGSHH